eukprot:TRINITY_DN2885_c0_g1_i1.p1 TRINITY_DN2885_c0_g1~~TRINITY_DN2885_c0_g1_i1.p1  ORF type:complete len:677 (+),score=99.22 TRINITY_DN2885_c0_g1_i1:86-2116(+)
MGCGASNDSDAKEGSVTSLENGKVLDIVPSERKGLHSPRDAVPYNEFKVNSDNVTVDPQQQTPVLPMKPFGRVTKLFNTNRMTCNFDEGGNPEKEVMWELMKGERILRWHVPTPETMNKNDEDCPPAVVIGSDLGKYTVQLSKEEASVIPRQAKNSVNKVIDIEEGLDLSALSAPTLLKNRWKHTRLKDFKVRMLIGHGRAIRIVGLSSDNRLLVTGDGIEGRQMLLRCADPSSGKRIGSLSGRGGTGEAPCDLCFSTNGQLLATCDQSDTVLIWDMTTFRCKKSVQFEGAEGSELFVVGVKLSPDGKLAIAAAEQSTDEGMNRGRVVIWDFIQKKQRLVFKEHTATVLCVALTPNSEMIMSGGRDGMLLVWKVSDGEVVYRLQGHPSGIRSCSFNHNCTMMLSLDAKVFALWSVNTGKCFFSRHIDGSVMEGEVVPTLPSPRAERPSKLRFTAAQFAPSGLILLASSDRIVRLIAPHDQSESFSFMSRAPISCASAGSKNIALGDMYGNVYIIDMILTACDSLPPLPPEPKPWDEEDEEEDEEAEDPHSDFEPQPYPTLNTDLNDEEEEEEEEEEAISATSIESPVAVDSDLLTTALEQASSRVKTRETEISPPSSPFRQGTKGVIPSPLSRTGLLQGRRRSLGEHEMAERKSSLNKRIIHADDDDEEEEKKSQE